MLHWIEKTFPVNPDTDDNISTIYRHVYNAIRKGIPYRVKTEEAVEVVRVTELVREQNPAFRLPRTAERRARGAGTARTVRRSGLPAEAPSHFPSGPAQRCPYIGPAGQGVR